jgi:hypothetical protein
VKVERLTDTSKEFEKYCMQEFMTEADAQGRNNHKRRKRKPDKPFPIATHDLWDEDEVTEEVQEPVVSHMLPAGMKRMVGI